MSFPEIAQLPFQKQPSQETQKPKLERFTVIDGGKKETKEETLPINEALKRDTQLSDYLEKIRLRDSQSDLEAPIKRLEMEAALKQGKEVSRLHLSEEAGLPANTNTVFRAEFLNSKQEKVAAFVKESKQETGIDENTDPSLKEAVRAWQSPAYFQAYSQQLIELYQIPPEEQNSFRETLRQEKLGSRLDVELGGSAVRERAVYTFSQLMKFDVVPSTALREVKDKNGKVTDIASVQEQVMSKDPNFQTRQLGHQELMTLAVFPEDMWADQLQITPEQAQKVKSSLIMGACLQWAVGAMDGHHENMFLTDEGIKYIDNGLSFGKARDVRVLNKEVKNIDGEVTKVDSTENFRAMRSVPMEIMRSNPEWTLSDEQKAHLQKLYTDVLSDGDATRAFEKTFLMMFPDRRIAKGQMKQFLLRLKHLADQGRPPKDAPLFSITTAALSGGGGF